MFIEGNPAPTFRFNKGSLDIVEGGRYKLISSDNNMIMLAISKVRATDEDEYKLTIENCHGMDEANFMLYVSGWICRSFKPSKHAQLAVAITYFPDGSGIDFRGMLKKKNYGKWDNEDEDPDWGALKHVEEEPKPVLKKVEKVSMDRIMTSEDFANKKEREKLLYGTINALG